MSRTLDILEHAEHGTPAGHVGGCRSRGGCPNHGHREQLTCVQAYRAFVHYFAFRYHDPDQPITRSMLRSAKGYADPTPRTVTPPPHHHHDEGAEPNALPQL